MSDPPTHRCRPGGSTHLRRLHRADKEEVKIPTAPPPPSMTCSPRSTRSRRQHCGRACCASPRSGTDAKIAAGGTDMKDEKRYKIASDYANRQNAEVEKLAEAGDKFNVEVRASRPTTAAAPLRPLRRDRQRNAPPTRSARAAAGTWKCAQLPAFRRRILAEPALPLLGGTVSRRFPGQTRPRAHRCKMSSPRRRRPQACSGSPARSRCACIAQTPASQSASSSTATDTRLAPAPPC